MENAGTRIRRLDADEIQNVIKINTAQFICGTEMYRSCLAANNESSAGSIRPAAVITAVSSVKA